MMCRNKMNRQERCHEQHSHTNEWIVVVDAALDYRGDARIRGEPLGEGSEDGLRDLFDHDPDPSRKIRALNSLFVIGGTDDSYLRGLLRHDHESVRAWAIRFLTDALPIDTIFSRRGGPDVALPLELGREFAALARNDPSALVRLVLASTLQRLPVGRRGELAEALVSRSEDDADHNIPAMIWTGLIPVAESDPNALVKVALACRLPAVLRLITRRLGEEIEKNPSPLNALLADAATRPEEFRGQVVAGLSDALAGWRIAAKPAAWDRLLQECSTSSDPTLQVRARDLNVLFGDGRAVEEVKRNSALDHSRIARTVEKVRSQQATNREPACQNLRYQWRLRTVVAAVLAFSMRSPLAPAENSGELRWCGDRQDAGGCLSVTFHPSERSSLIEILCSRPAFARALLDQIAAGKIPRQDLGAFHVRQIRGLGDPAISERLSEVWGVLRNSDAARRARIAALKIQLDAPRSSFAPDLGHGRGHLPDRGPVPSLPQAGEIRRRDRARSHRPRPR